MQHLLPLTLWTLIQSYLVSAQSPQSPRSLSLNSLTQFNSSSSLPNPAVFALPASNNLSVSIALCASTSSTPQFFVSNDTDGTDGTQVELTYGYGSWTGAQSGEGVLTVEGAGETPFEVGVSDNGPMHEILITLPFLGDTTSNQALLFSPPFDPPTIPIPTFPNYTLPPANLSFPIPPSNNTPNLILVLAPTVPSHSGVSLTSLPQTGCALRAANSSGSVHNSSIVLRDATVGFQEEWLVEGLDAQTNYTAYVVQDEVKVSGPINLVTKSASFSCPLVHQLPFCPSTAYAVPLPQPPFPLVAHDASSLPSSVTGPLLQYMTNFTTNLLSMACGRDLYSPIQTCADCQVAYRRWLCAISFPRCTESAPDPASSPSITGPTPTAQKPLSALSPQPSGKNATGRNPNLPPFSAGYTALLPCIETCNAVDRACPIFLGFRCPTAAFGGNLSYGIGYMDDVVSGEEGGGLTGAAQDQWGNVWCNGV